FLFRVTTFQENIDVRQNIERDWMRVNLRRRLSVLGRRFDLFFQFIDRARAAARNGLITCGEDALNSKGAMQWVNRHQRDCGGAIGIRSEERRVGKECRSWWSGSYVKKK